nr:protein inscuteable homolog [Onthophagus taurus]
MSFTRSASKVWWGSDEHDYINQRSISASPKSHDSGFSDNETFLHPRKSSGRKINDIEKNANKENYMKNSYNQKLIDKCEIPTPIRVLDLEVRSEPSKSFKYVKYSPKNTRSLFKNAKSLPNSPLSSKKIENIPKSNQYARKPSGPSINSEITYEDADSSWSSVDEEAANVTVPVPNKQKKIDFNISAPAVLTNPEDNYEEIKEDSIQSGRSLNYSLSPIQSDTDSELECLFADGNVESPKHTSTPKVFSIKSNLRGGKTKMNLLLKYHNERVPPLHENLESSCKLWQDEIRYLYDAECMTTLQSKSIAADLNEKVSFLASVATCHLTNLLRDIKMIESEFENLKSQPKHKDSLIQSTTGLIKEFLQKYKLPNTRNMKKHNEELRTFKLSDSITKLQKSFTHQTNYFLETQLMKFAESLEYAENEMDLRAKITGLTWICQRHPEVLKILSESTTIQNLLILCEKCDGSSVKALILRALTTLCCNSLGVRKFEKSSGIQTISDIIYERARPEPEKSEAIALLAQITAPWIEDNNKINGLQEHGKKLISALTDFLQTTSCCQNLLLTTAALANLSSMEPKSIKYILNHDTIKILFEAVRKRGPTTSIFLLEQVSTLIANVSSVEMARNQLARDEVPKVLMCFLHTDRFKEDIFKRLQQKSIIALSRVSSEPDAAFQIVQCGGIKKLVELCRDKSARYDSDAVLVATLATLRRIAENCGTSSIDTQDVQELVEPRLLDSFLAYSTQTESLV